MKPTETRPSYGALFDLDGVLIDSETEYTRIWGEIDARFPTGVENFPLVIKGTTLPHILDTYYPDEEMRSLVVEMLRSCEQAMEYRPIEGGIEFLDSLAEAGIPAAIVTSSNDEKMAHLYECLPGFRERFATIVTACDVKNSKPDPEGYRLAASRLGLQPERCCVFEDSFSGLEAGRRAGGAVIALATTNPRHTLEGLAHRIIDNFCGMTAEMIRRIIDN
ncbi:MAG: HAD family phosphatase [Muribaculaceae bacterium]|nr:HAD family phosphatase [Muribaculaceae bacterium]